MWDKKSIKPRLLRKHVSGVNDCKEVMADLTLKVIKLLRVEIHFSSSLSRNLISSQTYSPHNSSMDVYGVIKEDTSATTPHTGVNELQLVDD